MRQLSRAAAPHPGDPIHGNAARHATRPSPLTPEAHGTNPFSYPRLVQPVLDLHCVECHDKNKDKTINLGREPIERKWFASYNSLIERFAFNDYGHGYRTTPGQFGAREMLKELK